MSFRTKITNHPLINETSLKTRINQMKYFHKKQYKCSITALDKENLKSINENQQQFKNINDNNNSNILFNVNKKSYNFNKPSLVLNTLNSKEVWDNINNQLQKQKYTLNCSQDTPIKINKSTHQKKPSYYKIIKLKTPIKLKINKVIVSNIKNITNSKKIFPNPNEITVTLRLQENNVSKKPYLNINTNYFDSYNRINKTVKNGFKFMLSNYNRFSDNYLEMRKTINAFNHENMKEIMRSNGINELCTKNKQNKTTLGQFCSSIKEEEFCNQKYSKYFLPLSGTGLLIQT